MIKRDYSKGLIYKIVCNDTECKSIYIGSTISFKHRKSKHKSDCTNENKKSYNLKIYQSIRDNGGWDNWQMILVEYYPCETKLELEKREREIYEELKADLNTNKPYISKEEILEIKKENRKTNIEFFRKRDKEYYKNNKQKRLLYGKEYRELNTDKLKEYRKQKITCQCGSIVGILKVRRHERTKKHIKYMEQQK
jgi:hypothetical protein